MFSKEWLENCMCQISRYETPVKGGNMKSFKPGQKEDEDFGIIDDEVKEIADKEEDDRIKEKYAKLNSAMMKRKG
jgi:hypothetical protein